MTQTVNEPGRETPVVAETDVLVVGGGPAGQSAAVAAARAGAEVAVGGLALEIVDRLERIGACVAPPLDDCFRNDAAVRDRWVRWGFEELYARKKPKPIVYSAVFDPEGWKQVSQEMVLEAGVRLRCHSWFSRALVEDGAVNGVVVETKAGRQAIRGRVVIDATGAGDVFGSAGAPGVHGSYIMTLVHRLADVDTDAALAFERADPAAAQQLDREVKQLLGGSWEMWWLLTPRPGVVWCNCPHIPGHDGLDPEHQTKIEVEARRRFMKVADVVARGRDYYTPYRSLVPKGIEGLLVAGRCYSATSEAQRISREIPPLMVMGEAAGTAAALSLDAGVAPRRVDVPT